MGQGMEEEGEETGKSGTKRRITFQFGKVPLCSSQILEADAEEFILSRGRIGWGSGG